jgi:hypothetical protein
LDLNYLDGFSPSVGDSFELFDGPTSGSFSEVSLPALANGLSWDTDNLYTAGVVSVVPEPSTLAILGAGVVGLIFCGLLRHREL